MKSNSILFLFLFYPSFLFFSCIGSNSDDFELIKTESVFDFHAIELYDGILYATGGDVWNMSNMVSSSDGKIWTVDSLTNKSVFDLHSTNDFLYGVGNDGYIFEGQPEFQLYRTKHWGLLRAFTPSDQGFLTAGGKDFNKGWIYQVNSEFTIDTTFTFQNEILDISCLENGNCLACGYGVILHSSDAGTSWIRSNEIGDYYNSIGINNKGETFIVGYNGTIIKSRNDGVTWEKIKDGHSPLANNKPFRKIKFQENKGVIIGDNGLIWYSENDGDAWQDISINTQLDLFDFEFHQNKLICVSEAGQIILLNLP